MISEPPATPHSRLLAPYSPSAESGRTVIIVTHDADIATRAGRVIRMQDGRLQDS